MLPLTVRQWAGVRPSFVLIYKGPPWEITTTSRLRLLSHYGQKLYTPSMANINATTPQLQVFKSVVEAYMTRDLSNVAPYLSKDFKFQTFPKIADLPDLAKAEHVEKYGAIYRSFSKVDVRS